ncbi:hypothetical protein CSKR_103019 [Clonorchis sinensis]|uniref:Uncharacterized protein n=1 Tax=Clonorchis sinensis TaxID=79923 RepID=A0A3R7CQD6_CLOSI|nr:hypothetical protein CSKR_103019 [Clonorchis sinensis]
MPYSILAPWLPSDGMEVEHRKVFTAEQLSSVLLIPQTSLRTISNGLLRLSERLHLSFSLCLVCAFNLYTVNWLTVRLPCIADPRSRLSINTTFIVLKMDLRPLSADKTCADHITRCSKPHQHIVINNFNPLPRMARWLQHEFTGQKVHGLNLTSATRLPLSMLGQPGSMPPIALPSSGTAAMQQTDATAERKFVASKIWTRHPSYAPLL